MWEGQERTIRETGVGKGSGKTGLSSEMSVNTKEEKAFEDVLNPSLIRLSIDKKCESMFKNIFGLLMEGKGGNGYPFHPFSIVWDGGTLKLKQEHETKQ